MVYSLGELEPVLADDVWVAPDAQVIGDVQIGAGSGIWFGAIIRGDVHYVRIGRNCNIQDGSVLHVTTDRCPLVLGDNCTLGHRVTLHGCTLKDYAFIGIGATVLDDVEIGEFAFVAAGSLVTPGKKIPPRTMAMGSPAKPIREITDAEEELIRSTAEKYRQLKDRYRGGGLRSLPERI